MVRNKKENITVRNNIPFHYVEMYHKWTKKTNYLKLYCVFRQRTRNSYMIHFLQGSTQEKFVKFTLLALKYVSFYGDHLLHLNTSFYFFGNVVVYPEHL